MESAISVTSSRAKSRDLSAGGDNVVCVIAENGNASAKGTRKRGVRGIVLDFAGNDGMGGSKSPRNVGWRQAVLSVSSYRA